MVVNGEFNRMVAYRNPSLTSVSLAEAVAQYNHVSTDHYLIDTAKRMGVSFGD